MSRKGLQIVFTLPGVIGRMQNRYNYYLTEQFTRPLMVLAYVQFKTSLQALRRRIILVFMDDITVDKYMATHVMCILYKKHHLLYTT